MRGLSTKIDSRYLLLAEELPHGSGIDCDWFVRVSGRFICFANSYHCMNEDCYYVGWQDFTIKISYELYEFFTEAKLRVQNLYEYDESAIERLKVLRCLIAENFILEFNGDQYLARRYELRDYLTELISHWRDN